MCKQREFFAIVICIVCAVGCGVEDPAGGAFGEPETPEELGVVSQEVNVGMGYLPINTPRTVQWAGCTFVVQHGVFIFTPYAKVRYRDCTCIITPIATFVDEKGSVRDWRGIPDNCGSGWNEVTVPLTFGPRLIGSKYAVVPPDISRAATLLFTVFQ